MSGQVLWFGVLFLATIVLIVTIWQMAATARAKAALTREEEYRHLTERSTAAQEATRQQLHELNQRMEALERILREVE